MIQSSAPTPKALLVKILQWFYLLIGLAIIPVPLLYQQNFSNSIGLPMTLVWGIAAAASAYCLLLFVSFLTQNNNLLILSLVFIFLTTLVGVGLFIAALPNISNITHGLPSCVQNISGCSFKDGIIVASGASFATALPLLFLNILTIIGSVKAIAATD